MSRSAHLGAALVIGSLPVAVVIGVFHILRFVPTSCFTLPNRDYWLAPERRQATLEYLERQGFWLACLIVAFMTEVQFLILQANTLTVPALRAGKGWIMIFVFLAAIGAWVIALIRHFIRIPGPR